MREKRIRLSKANTAKEIAPNPATLELRLQMPTEIEHHHPHGAVGSGEPDPTL